MRCREILVASALGLLLGCASAPDPRPGPPSAAAEHFPVLHSFELGAVDSITFSADGEYLFGTTGQESRLVAVRLREPWDHFWLDLGFVPVAAFAHPDREEILMLGTSGEEESAVIARLDASGHGLRSGEEPSDPGELEAEFRARGLETWPLGRSHTFSDVSFSSDRKTLYYTDLDSSAVYILDLDLLDRTAPGSALKVGRFFLEHGPGSTLYAPPLSTFLAVLHPRVTGEAAGSADVSLIDRTTGKLAAFHTNAERGVSQMALATVRSASPYALMLVLDGDGSYLRFREIDFEDPSFGPVFSSQLRLAPWDSPASGRLLRLQGRGASRMVLAISGNDSSEVAVFVAAFSSRDSPVLLDFRGNAVADRPIHTFSLSPDGHTLATVGQGVLTLFTLD